MRRNPPGPPPKPAELRQRRNKPTTVAALRDASEPVVALKPPSGLLPSTRKVWRAYWTSQVARAADVNADGPILVRWITLLDEWERALSAFRSARVVKGTSGQPTMSPLLTYLKYLSAEVSHCEQQLGLTPSARARLGLVLSEAQLTIQQLNRNLEQAEQERPALAPALAAEWEAL